MLEMSRNCQIILLQNAGSQNNNTPETTTQTAGTANIVIHFHKRNVLTQSLLHLLALYYTM